MGLNIYFCKYNVVLEQLLLFCILILYGIKIKNKFCSDLFLLESVRFFKILMLLVEEKYFGEINVFSEEGIYI